MAERRPATVVSWNLQGLAGVVAAAVARVLRQLDADVVALQEVGRAQARAVREALAWPKGVWSFKHAPVKRLPEGHALLARTMVLATAHVVSRREPPWGWQRRIAQVGRVPALLGDLRIVNTHLAASAAADQRRSQAQRIIERWHPDVVVGDLNEARGPALDAFRAAGYTDAGPAGALTNWSHADRTQPPDQRLDWCFVSPRVTVLGARLGDSRLTGALSDHVPLAVTLAPST